MMPRVKRNVIFGLIAAAALVAYVARSPQVPAAVQSKTIAMASVARQGETDPEKLLRIYDFTPVSEANLVVASVEGTEIVIPRSEFAAHLKAHVPEDLRKNLDMAAKRRQLERLVDDLVMLRDAYARKVDQNETVGRAMEGTRKMLLVELLNREEVVDKARSAEDYAKLQAALDHRLFEAAEISVSNEAYAALRDAVAARDAGGQPSPDPSAQILATCGDIQVGIGEAFAAYAALPPDKRPNLMAPEGLSALLEKIMADGLKMAEARRRRIDQGRPYRALVQANRASLTRMWIEDRIADKARRQIETAGQRRLGAPPPARDELDELQERIRAGRAASLRQGLEVKIDEPMLERSG